MKQREVGKVIMKWDTSAFTEDEVAYRLESGDEQYEGMDEEDIREDLYQDTDIFEIWWDDLTEFLTETLLDKNPGGEWSVGVRNFGWLNRDGYKNIVVKDGKDFLSEILPNTDCTFKISEWGKDGLAIQNWHHDSPMGNEWYYAKPK